jgi:glutathione S-transferase
LAEEDSLHADLRSLTFGFVLPRALAAKPQAQLEAFEALGPRNEGRAREVRWWQQYALEGVGSAEATAAVLRFDAAFGRLEERLEWLATADPRLDSSAPGRRAGTRDPEGAAPRGPCSRPSGFLCGGHVTVADVAWAINVNRLELCGESSGG